MKIISVHHENRKTVITYQARLENCDGYDELKLTSEDEPSIGLIYALSAFGRTVNGVCNINGSVIRTVAFDYDKAGLMSGAAKIVASLLTEEGAGDVSVTIKKPASDTETMALLDVLKEAAAAFVTGHRAQMALPLGLVE